VEGYGLSATTDHVAVRRDPINPEVTRLDSGRIHWSENVDNEISQLRQDNAVTGWLGTDH
jgi:hypothetical protein